MRKEKILWKVTAVLSLFVMVICGTLFLTANSLFLQETKDVDSGSEEKNELDKKVDYAFETSYNGEPYLSDKLFSLPFQKTSDYICNKDYITTLGEENADILANKSKEVVEQLFNRAYKDRLSENEKLASLMANGICVIGQENILADNNSETAILLNKWFTDNEITMEAKLYTDKCMVYYDKHSIIVRGLMNFAAYECNDTLTLSETFGIENMQLGEEYEILLEFYFIPDMDRHNYSEYKLSQMQNISY